MAHRHSPKSDDPGHAIWSPNDESVRGLAHRLHRKIARGTRARFGTPRLYQDAIGCPIVRRQMHHLQRKPHPARQTPIRVFRVRALTSQKEISPNMRRPIARPSNHPAGSSRTSVRRRHPVRHSPTQRFARPSWAASRGWISAKCCHAAHRHRAR